VDSFAIAAASACWLGILTSISPCPLATNIAAITYIGKRVDRPAYVLSAGLLYTLGRTITYVVLGVMIVAGALAISDLSFFLQRNMNKILGPILLLAGFVLLGTIKFNMSGPSFADRLQGRIEKYGLWGAGVLGLLFALSFCPVSAALFFGSLIPLAVEQESSVIMPTLYGIGTALPVFVFAALIALGARFVGVTFNRLAVFEKWARRITAVIFILVGVYYCLTYLFNIQIW
jgi:sulfite exporter TauE/SafE